MVVHHHNQGRIEIVTHQEPLRKARVAHVQIVEDLDDDGAATVAEDSLMVSPAFCITVNRKL